MGSGACDCTMVLSATFDFPCPYYTLHPPPKISLPSFFIVSSLCRLLYLVTSNVSWSICLQWCSQSFSFSLIFLDFPLLSSIFPVCLPFLMSYVPKIFLHSGLKLDFRVSIIVQCRPCSGEENRVSHVSG